MSTVMEIKAAIERLSPAERAKLHSLVWPPEDSRATAEADTPPGVGEKLAQAAKGRFAPGDRGNIDKILTSLR
jgi:hypothetical protein